MSRLLNVSLVTASKAVQLMQARGLVTARPKVGTFIAAPRTGVTKILLNYTLGNRDTLPGPFHIDLLHAVQQSFEDPERAVTMSALAGRLLEPAQFVASLHSRAVDSVVVYRPPQPLHLLLKAAARELPVVSLCSEVENSEVDLVMPEVEQAVEQMVHRRLAAGGRDFALIRIAHREDFWGNRGAVYEKMIQTFTRTLQQAGLAWSEHLADTHDLRRSGAGFMPVSSSGQPLPPGTLVFMETPAVFKFLPSDAPQRWDLMTYTEFAGTFEEFRRDMSMIFCDLRRAGQEAVACIRRRRSGEVVRGDCQVIPLTPQIWDRFGNPPEAGIGG